MTHDDDRRVLIVSNNINRVKNRLIIVFVGVRRLKTDVRKCIARTTVYSTSCNIAKQTPFENNPNRSPLDRRTSISVIKLVETVERSVTLCAAEP